MERSDALCERAVDALPGGNTRTTLFVAPHPPYARSGHGFTVVDEDGHELIDLQNNYTSLIHGHAHPEVTAAAVEALQEGASVGLPTRHEVELAGVLRERIRAGERWRFTNSGTEAVMIAIRAARARCWPPWISTATAWRPCCSTRCPTAPGCVP